MEHKQTEKCNVTKCALKQRLKKLIAWQR